MISRLPSRHSRSSRSAAPAAPAPHSVRGGWAFFVGVLIVNCAMAVLPEQTAQLLKAADDIKTSNRPQFEAILKSLDEQSAQLTTGQLEYLRYLKAWKAGYDGDYDNAMPQLQAVINESKDVTLRFRAGVSFVNLLSLSARYEQALSELSRLVDLLPRVTDRDAREQGLLVAAMLYDEVGQYDLGLRYAQAVIDGKGSGSDICKAGQPKVLALARSGKLQATSDEFQVGIDACLKVGEPLWANIIRSLQAEAYIHDGRIDEAIGLLTVHYEEATNTHYRRLISAFDSLLAEAYRSKGASGPARQYALAAIDNAVKNAYTEPLITAYRVLYELAKEQGDFAAALAFHEKYTAADKGYLDDAGVRRLAYQKVRHESIANKLQVDGLKRQNQALHLERELAGKAVETSRLYIAMLILILAFIALWAYMTKRSQLHFMALSQLDGLTGICNRPHFIDQAEKRLQHSRESGQEVCVILFDLDHFKTINDKYGHATGDFVLKRTVEACDAHLRENDVFARVGGEEFAILLSGCEVDEARQRAEQLRTTVATTDVYRGVAKAPVTASFGVAASSRSGYELRQLLAHADVALYQAKHTGRDRVVLYDAMDNVAGLVVAVTAASEAAPSS
jgi:diguanylate cyclase (GGDEF)-like protein